ncbi:DUF4912 domain-containing protein [Desulforamulus aeronauticus]|uniref:DUF4912 domain-containing protein n=1 Tax=Desulforamulus aeronauticus DSM 10349 TaxID=1121421 RepID=A0A1M6R7I6_9FIRM|nr:DUF4912 domain-containing protein [Desulforamulus aeronauticus]SHK28287.1 hypothetical protein SAMN02745123_01334 [Desulforamulus aeronauticus DSM 10349]
MDSVWLWLLGSVIVIALIVFMLPSLRKHTLASKKSELPPKPKRSIEEMAEEICPVPSSKWRQDEPFIPHHYGVSRLVVLVKDPYWLYAYWEVSLDKQKDFIKRYGQEAWHNSRQILRIYDVTGLDNQRTLTGHSFQEIYLDPFADNWFIHVGQPERSFFLELGRLLPDGTYINLLTSNRVCTPRDTISPRMEEQWMWIEGIYRNFGNMRYGTSSATLAGTEEGYKQ